MSFFSKFKFGIQTSECRQGISTFCRKNLHAEKIDNVQKKKFMLKKAMREQTIKVLPSLIGNFTRCITFKVGALTERKS